MKCRKDTKLSETIINFLTIDVEEWFHVHALSNVVNSEDWECFEPKIEKTTHKILDLLDSTEGPLHSASKSKQRATFFILGWIAEHYPALVKEIYARGHEVACHGYAHQCLFNQTPKKFKEDTKKSRKILEDLVGDKIIGYRAPTFSMTQKTLWALNILKEEGYQYDSSVFPILHDYYGIASAPRFPFLWDLTKGNPQIKNLKKFPTDFLSSHAQCSLFEFPISSIRLLGQNLPVGGGGYFRLYPYFLTKAFFKKINKKNKPFTFYIHPWELDPDIPRICKAKKLSQFRTYINLEKAENRFRRLLSEFHFSTISDLFFKNNL